MKKVTDETYALTGAGGVKKARFRLFLPEESDSEKSVVLVLSYALQNPSVMVPEWVSALIAQTIQASPTRSALPGLYSFPRAHR